MQRAWRAEGQYTQRSLQLSHREISWCWQADNFVAGIVVHMYITRVCTLCKLQIFQTLYLFAYHRLRYST